MRRILILIAGVAACTSLGIAAASAMLGGGTSAQPAARSGDARPADTPRLTARAKHPRGGPDAGMVVYENGDGQTCTATGEVSGERVGVHGPRGFEPLPLDEGGACGGVLDPVTIAVARDHANGVATVWGRALPEVERIDARVAGRTLRVPLQREQTFITMIEGFDGGSVTLEVRMRGGQARTVKTMPFPAAAPPGHAHGAG